MNDLLTGLDRHLESRVRLGVMSALAPGDPVDYTTLKNLLQLTDGNLASHLKALEQAEYVRVEKTYNGRKPLTLYHITPTGATAFRKHLDALEALIKGVKSSEL